MGCLTRNSFRSGKYGTGSWTRKYLLPYLLSYLSFSTFEQSLKSLKVVLQRDKRYVKIVDSGSASAGLPCCWLEVDIKCRFTRQLVVKSGRWLNKRRNSAPLFNSEHLLSKPISQLEGGGINLCVQLTVKNGSLDQLQCGHQVFLTANFHCHFAFC